MSKPKRARFPWLFLLLVIVPTVLSTVYYYRYASPQYVSESHFIIQGNAAPKLDFLGALTGIPGMGGGTSDAMIIRDVRAFREHYKKVSPDVNFDLDIQCPNCESTIKARMPFGANFFWPDLGT